MNSDNDNANSGNQEQAVTGSEKRHPLGESGEQWLQAILENSPRMTLDEEFRKKIEKDLS